MSVPLELPQRWVEQLVRQRAATLRPVLNLSMLSSELTIPDDRPQADVKADLERGAWLVRDARRPDHYRLGGDEFVVTLHCRPGGNSGRVVAIIRSVALLDAVPPSVRMRPRVGFIRVRNEAECDLGSMLRRMDQTSAVRIQLERARQPVELRNHGALQAMVSKEYGQLGTLLTLLAERAARQPEHESSGVVLAGDRVRIELDTFAEKLHNRRVTVLVGDDEEYQTQVSRVRGRVITVEPMRGWEADAGTAVRVVAATRFAMRQNAEALDRFRRGDVVGDWNDLASLLCDTKQLRLPAALTPPARFFDDNLNDEQREAITRAVATPHAFLIQGPPGTGKTTVISELIQQLVARGERVLMLAPSHVAVDEVLRRVGAKPGVRALRITWTTDKVEGDLHPYLFDRVGRDLARRALREGADRSQMWARRMEELDEQAAALFALREAAREEVARKGAYLAAGQNLKRLAADVEAGRAGHVREPRPGP